ncbi:MAG: hypothetical protein PHD36_01150 [Desulfotomaculaceae bacterium]|nr:hypothetical protein [Desulfotomaculaceae bacterium]
MSLTETSVFEAVKNQYLYKLKSRPGMFLAMAGVQVMALLFSLGGVSKYGMGSQYIDLSVKYFSSEMVVGFTFLWIFVVAVLITKKDYQNIDFTFVSNRLSSNLSNAAFLVTAALVGGVTAMLSGFLLRIIVYFNGSIYLLSQNFIVTPEVIFTGIAVTILYLLLLGSLGYFCGTLARLSQVFIVLLAGIFFGLMIFGGAGNQLPALLKVFDFFGGESSLTLLAVKVILTAGLFYACSVILSNRLEVR